jgi:hypothetical protein
MKRAIKQSKELQIKDFDFVGNQPAFFVVLKFKIKGENYD